MTRAQLFKLATFCMSSHRTLSCIKETGYHDFKLYQLRAEGEGKWDNGPWHPRWRASIRVNYKN